MALLLLYCQNTFDRNLDDYQFTVALTDFSGGNINFNESENLIALKFKPYDESKGEEIFKNLTKFAEFSVVPEVKNLTSGTVKRGKPLQLAECNKI